jgi:hypothetical protein
MERSDCVTLIGHTFTVDDNGVQQESETKRDAYAIIKSISQTEFFEGGRNGLNPQLVFSLYEYDYQNEETIEYKQKRYTAYRTFFNKDGRIDVYTELRKGKDV